MESFKSVTKCLISIVVLSLILVSSPLSVWAVTSTANATVSATVTQRASVTLMRDVNSVTRFSAGTVVFDRMDDQDGAVTNPNPGFMYAPYRSETGKNWHLASILANGSSLTLTANVSGTVGSTPLANVISVFCGGFFVASATTPIAGTPSSDWEPLNAFTRTVNQPFTGTVPFNYRLNISGAPAGTYAGSITYTLTSN